MVTKKADMGAARFSKTEIRKESAHFAKRWQTTTSEAGEKQTFWNEFFNLFGVDRKQVAAFEALGKRASTGGRGSIDLIYPNQMAVEHKSKGKDLDKALGQLMDYLPEMVSESITPWLLVVSDFETIKWLNTLNHEEGEFKLSELPNNLHIFWWLAGHESPNESFKNEEECNFKATDIMASLHDSLSDSGYPEEDRRIWMTRILFCMFADDTGIWDRALFHAFIAHSTKDDGSDLGPRVAEIFQTLNTPDSKRSKLLTEEMRDFSYINGDLFEEQISIPACDRDIRDNLLRACQFNWASISPAIFGSMFQNVMTKEERRSLGAHYTEESKILRVINPLCIDNLKSELDQCNSLEKLLAFHEKLSSLKFLDPACGCGNFLIITYREIRQIEASLIERIQKEEYKRSQRTKKKRLSPGQFGINLDLICKVNVSQFYGIEIEEFPTRIARVAMYLIDHMQNRILSERFGTHHIRFPIRDTPQIVNKNALEVSWGNIMNGEVADYIVGNPPFIGISQRSETQTSELKEIWKSDYHGSLDYVTAWYRKAIQEASDTHTQISFVSTNSICQGEQVFPLWSWINNQQWEISFAHQTFKWTSKAKGAANVHCVIIGISQSRDLDQKRLFQYERIDSEPIEHKCKNINAYLVDSKNILVAPRQNPFSHDLPEVRYGNKPTDDGNFIVSDEDIKDLQADPIAAKYLRRYIGARELLNSNPRWCIWLKDASNAEIKSSKYLLDRVLRVKKFRENSKAKSTQESAKTPHLFRQISQAGENYLCIPRHVSEARHFFTIDYYDQETIASDATFIADDPSLIAFSVLSSSMFMSWFKLTGGRIKSDLRFNKLLVYNTFPIRKLKEDELHALKVAGENLLSVRRSLRSQSLSAMYKEPLSIELIEAHSNIDSIIDGAFGLNNNSKPERIDLLIKSYNRANARQVNA